MKKLFFTLLTILLLTACGSTYNSALKQIQLGMTKQEVISLMGDKYLTTDSGETSRPPRQEVIEYVDKFKYHWLFEFMDGKLVKWWKETE